jgi:hypothetical protein
MFEFEMRLIFGRGLESDLNGCLDTCTIDGRATDTLGTEWGKESEYEYSVFFFQVKSKSDL